MDTPQELEEVLQLLRADRKLDAVKQYRELKGCSLLEAKRACEELQQKLAGAATPTLPPQTESDDEAVIAAIRAGRILDAVKLHREATGASLLESKQHCDRLKAQLAERADDPQAYVPPQVDRSTGCAGTLLLLAVLAGVLRSLL